MKEQVLSQQKSCNMTMALAFLRKSYQVVIVIGFFTSSIAGQSLECSRNSLDVCAEEVNKPYGLKAPGLVFTPDQIRQACSPLLDAEQCINDYFKSCPESSSMTKPKINPPSERQIVICRFLLDRYIQHINCYLPLNETYNKCVQEEAETAFRDNVVKITGGNKELQQEGCCYISNVFECALAPTRKSCSPEAAGTLKEFIEFPLEGTITPICRQFNCTTAEEVSPSQARGPKPEGSEEQPAVTRSPNNGVFHSVSVALCFIAVAVNFAKL